MVVDKLVFALLVFGLAAPALLRPAAADAPCTMPGTPCSVDPGINCVCYGPYDQPFDPSDPLAVHALGCPSCPNLPGSCPNLRPASNKQKVCHRDSGSNGPFRMIEVSTHAVQAHLNHGDFLPCPATCCSCDMELCNQRKHSLDVWRNIGRVFDGLDLSVPAIRQQAYQIFSNTLASIFTQNIDYQVTGVGVFNGRTIATEYTAIITPLGGTSVQGVYSLPFNDTWIDDNTVEIQACDRWYFNSPGSPPASFTQYTSKVRHSFVSGGAMMNGILITPGCAFRALPSPYSEPEVQGICYALDQACTAANGVTDYAFAGNSAGCIDFWTGLSTKAAFVQNGTCAYRYPGTSNTGQCRLTHWVIAITLDPVVHCVHTNPVSAPCHDVATDDPGLACPYRDDSLYN